MNTTFYVPNLSGVVSDGEPQRLFGGYGGLYAPRALDHLATAAPDAKPRIGH